MHALPSHIISLKMKMKKRDRKLRVCANATSIVCLEVNDFIVSTRKHNERAASVRPISKKKKPKKNHTHTDRLARLVTRFDVNDGKEKTEIQSVRL